jgi:hypothetical protein
VGKSVSKALLAWWVPGSRDVVNGIAVEPPEEDAPIRIEEAVRIALDKDPSSALRKFASGFATQPFASPERSARARRETPPNGMHGCSESMT